jgi:hypothetical protein
LPDESQLVRTLADFARAAENLGVRWYLFGARALAVWGAVRATEDVDVTADLGDLPTSRLVEVLERPGFERRFPYDDDFVARTRVVPLVNSASGMAKNVVLAGPGLEEKFLDGAVPVAFGGVTIPVLRPEDLIVTKILAARHRYLDDVDATSPRSARRARSEPDRSSPAAPRRRARTVRFVACVRGRRRAHLAPNSGKGRSYPPTVRQSGSFRWRIGVPAGSWPARRMRSISAAVNGPSTLPAT